MSALAALIFVPGAIILLALAWRINDRRPKRSAPEKPMEYIRWETPTTGPWRRIVMGPEEYIEELGRRMTELRRENRLLHAALMDEKNRRATKGTE